MEQALANSLFPVYLSLQAIHKDKAFLQKRLVIILRAQIFGVRHRRCNTCRVVKSKNTPQKHCGENNCCVQFQQQHIITFIGLLWPRSLLT